MFMLVCCSHVLPPCSNILVSGPYPQLQEFILNHHNQIHLTSILILSSLLYLSLPGDPFQVYSGCNFVCVLNHCYSYLISPTVRFSLFHCPNNIRRRVQIIKLSLCYSLPLGPNIHLSTSFSNNLSL